MRVCVGPFNHRAEMNLDIPDRRWNRANLITISNWCAMKFNKLTYESRTIYNIYSNLICGSHVVLGLARTQYGY